MGFSDSFNVPTVDLKGHVSTRIPFGKSSLFAPVSAADGVMKWQDIVDLNPEFASALRILVARLIPVGTTKRPERMQGLGWMVSLLIVANNLGFEASEVDIDGAREWLTKELDYIKPEWL